MALGADSWVKPLVPLVTPGTEAPTVKSACLSRVPASLVAIRHGRTLGEDKNPDHLCREFPPVKAPRVYNGSLGPHKICCSVQHPWPAQACKNVQISFHKQPTMQQGSNAI